MSDPHTIDFRFRPSSSWTLLCHPDDPHKSLVREDGALLYGFHADSFESWQFDRVFEFTAETTHPPVRVTQATESARRPIVHTTLTYPDQTVRLVTFAHDHSGVRCDIVLWEIEAHADIAAALHVDAYLSGAALAAVGATTPATALHVVPLTPRPRFPSWTDDIPRVDEPPAGPPALVSAVQPFIGTSAAGFRPATGLMTWPVSLAPGETLTGAVVLPLSELPAAAVLGAGVELAWARQALERERRFWDGLELRRLAISVPDDGVQDMLDACARNLLQAREIEQGLPVLHVGPTIYRGLWLVDGHFMLEAARYLGLDEVADAGLDVLLRRVKPTGAITQLDGMPHIKETAIAVATLVRQAQLSGDLARLRRDWPVVLAAAAHIDELRRASYQLPPDHPLHGLMPEAFGDGGLGDVRAEYTTVFWTLIGLRHAVAGARLIGAEEDGRRMEAELRTLHDAFERSAASQRRPLAEAGEHYLPMGPGGGGHQFLAGVADADVPRWRQVQPETATWAFCHAIWPGEVFAPDAPYVADLLTLFDRRDDEQGIPATTGWLSHGAVWTYAASFAAHVWLWAGRPDKAVDYLYAFINHASPTRVWREEQSLGSTGRRQICGDMPHNWASAELIRLVRHLLVMERGGRLELLAGAPEEWLAAGKRIRVDNTPTAFGRVSLAIDAGDDRLSVRVTVTAGVEPVRECRLRLPARLRNKVLVDGQEAGHPDADGWLRLQLTPGAETSVEVL